jgi:membrane-bound lytic murein transglycosylase MltF
MRKRRLIRVLVVYNKTNYFIDRGTPRGITIDTFKMFEDWINAKYKTGNLRIHVVLMPVRDAIAELLFGGKGDIAAASLVTAERLGRVDFSTPVVQTVNEIVVSGPTSQPIASTPDPSSREVFVRKGSIYHEMFDARAPRCRRRRRSPLFSLSIGSWAKNLSTMNRMYLTPGLARLNGSLRNRDGGEGMLVCISPGSLFVPVSTLPVSAIRLSVREFTSAALRAYSG